jgi:hypothetical protein
MRKAELIMRPRSTGVEAAFPLFTKGTLLLYFYLCSAFDVIYKFYKY